MDEEISLRELIEILLAGKWLIIAITVLAILISGVVTFCLIEPTYEAKTVLAVNLTGNAKSDENIVQSYLTQAKSGSVLDKVSEKLKADAQEISLQALAGKINITHLKDTNLFEVTVKDHSSQRAAKIANTFVEEFITFITETNKQKVSENLALLEKQVNEGQTKLQSYIDEMQELLKQPESVAELETELGTNLQILSEYQLRKANLQIETQKISAAITSLENQLSTIPEKIELKGSSPSDSFSTGNSEREELNPVYLKLKEELELNKMMLVQLNTEKALVDQTIKTVSSNVSDLQIKLTNKKIEQEQIQKNLDKAKENLFQGKYRQSQLVESLDIGGDAATIVSPAYEPTTPIAPKKALNLAVATCLGLMLGVFVVLFRAYWVNSAADKKQQAV